MQPKIYYESKTPLYIGVLAVFIAVLVLSFINASLFDFFYATLLVLLLVMIIVVFLSPSAKISLFEDRLEFKKGKQSISVSWKDVLNIHKDPVFANDIFSYYLARRFAMGGVFLETTKGYTKYFAPQLIRMEGSNMKWKDLVDEIKAKSNAEIKTGKVSIFKQKTKLFDVVFIILACLLAPIIVILLYGLFTGTIGESLMIVKDLFSLLV